MFAPLRVCVSVCRYVLKITGKVLNGVLQKLLRMMIIIIFRAPSSWILKAVDFANTVKALYFAYIMDF